MTSRRVLPRTGPIAAAAALSMALTACTGGSGEGDPAGGAEDAGTPAEHAEPGASGAETEARGEAAEESLTETEGEPLSVSAEGDGPVGLAVEGFEGSEGLGDEADEVSGRLIGGPGGCMALAGDDHPRLLLFGEDAEFVLRGERPSVTTEELGTAHLGEAIDVDAVEVPLEEVDGIPDRCARGAAETVLFAAG